VITASSLNRRLPNWFRQDLPGREVFERLKVICEAGVHTVCQEAKCPNLGRCFTNGEVTFLLLGNICTRNCSFCNIRKVRPEEELVLDPDEPRRIVQAVKLLGLDYIVITSVTRDDLEDGGAKVFAQTIRLLRLECKKTGIELLIPDFAGNVSSLSDILAFSPDILGHNLETVERLYSVLRPQADYRRSLKVLFLSKSLNPGVLTKSSLMLGLGEEEDELLQAMEDLRAVGCDYLVLGQYLAPSSAHYPVKEFISPEVFSGYKRRALSMGFKGVQSAPLARSSYRARDLVEI
jgi:lipoic acid synthetase